jgi:hypothetical protein
MGGSLHLGGPVGQTLLRYQLNLSYDIPEVVGERGPVCLKLDLSHLGKHEQAGRGRPARQIVADVRCPSLRVLQRHLENGLRQAQSIAEERL